MSSARGAGGGTTELEGGVTGGVGVAASCGMVAVVEEGEEGGGVWMAAATEERMPLSVTGLRSRDRASWRALATRGLTFGAVFLRTNASVGTPSLLARSCFSLIRASLPPIPRGAALVGRGGGARTDTSYMFEDELDVGSAGGTSRLPRSNLPSPDSGLAEGWGDGEEVLGASSAGCSS